MANEITVNVTLSYADSEGTDETLQTEDDNANVSSKKYTKAKVSVGTNEEAIPLGEATAPGWFYAKNLDDTNFVTIKTGTSGTVFAKLLAGECCVMRLGSGAQAPYWTADTAACQVEYMVVNT